jgi:hypothetical protein
MRRRLSYFVCIFLVLAVAGINVVRGEIWEDVVKGSEDAVEDQLIRGMYSSSSDLEFPYDGGLQVIGLRFQSVGVPAGASVDNAYIEFTVDEVENDLPVNLVIDGEFKVNPAKFGSTGFDVVDRERTNAKAFWSPEHFPTVGGKHQSSDISDVIEEIVNQPGWFSGADLVIIISDNPDNPSLGLRTVETGRGDDSSPKLHVEWSLGNARTPYPAHGQSGVSIDTILSWQPGVYAADNDAHTLYFGESADGVRGDTGGITQSATTYDPGRLEYCKTYYWRVREKNGPPDNGFNDGNIWSFTTEYFSYPMDGGNIIATASSAGEASFGPENTINGSGLDESDRHSTDPLDMWLSSSEPGGGAWIQYEFDKVYKLDKMWVWNSNQVSEDLFGFGLKDVTVEYSTDGADWTTLADTPEFDKAAGTSDYQYNTTVDFGSVPAKYVKLTVNSSWGDILPQYSLSEVRFFYIPVGATAPSPEVGATDVDARVVLGWRAGREAVTHDVYLGTDKQSVIDGTAAMATVAEAMYGPDNLTLSTEYHWKVVEVNDAETPSTWESSVWSFTVGDSVVVDDFESYNDIDPPDPASHRIFETWIDGFQMPTNGALVGYDPPQPSYTEQSIVRGGRQSVPLFYSNTNGAISSEIKRTFETPQDWTKNGVTTLVVWFQGTGGNTGQMFAKINDTEIPNDGPTANVALEGWQAWGIDLATSGANLQTVNSLSIGIDGNAAEGVLYIDEIQLVATAPEPVREWSIIDDNDDVEEAVNGGGMDVGSSDLEMPYEDENQSNPQIIGLRFVGVPIPKGATITEAWLRFQVDETKGGTGPVNLIIEGDLSPNAVEFTSDALTVSSRTRTTAQVKWSMPNWVTVGDQGPDQTTPSLVPIIQEIVNQDGWAGGSIALIISDDPANPSVGIRCAEAGPGDDAALLHISYE